jgi:hypothetical protein
MVETAMLKVWSTEALWNIVMDTFQIHGGAAYFTDHPMERIFRDHRINQIGEGANDVLRSFIALVGMRGPGEQLRDLRDAIFKPWSFRSMIWGFARQRASGAFRRPDVPVQNSELRPHAAELGRLIKHFGSAVETTLFKYREEVLERQLEHERIAEAAMELFSSACVLSRLDAELSASPSISEPQRQAATLFLKTSARRIRDQLSGLRSNDNSLVTKTAESWLGRPSS